MVYQSAAKTLKCVQNIFCSKVNEVYICEDIQSKTVCFYTLWVIHDHGAARELLEIFEKSEVKREAAYLETFSSEDDFCVLFDYKPERRLTNFYVGRTFSLHECETVCLNLIMECISTKLPYPLLYLVLTQHQIHMSKDKSIYFSYGLDLEQLDSKKTESDCVSQCALILIGLLEPKKKEKAISYKILEMKLPKQCYRSFTELYKDVKLAAVPSKNTKLRKRIKAFWKRNQNLFFKILLVLCIIFGSAALIMIISQLIWGDIPFYRFFINPFRMIGTESLLQ